MGDRRRPDVLGLTVERVVLEGKRLTNAIAVDCLDSWAPAGQFRCGVRDLDAHHVLGDAATAKLGQYGAIPASNLDDRAVDRQRSGAAKQTLHVLGFDLRAELTPARPALTTGLRLVARLG